MPEEIKNVDWTIQLDNPRSNWGGTPSGPNRVTVHAAYLRFSDGQPFIEFKDKDHKLVYFVSASAVISIARA